jgi:hypothetical protein
MTRPVTLRLEDPDYERLQREAAQLGIKPGTLARVLLHASLGVAAGKPRGSRRPAAVLDRLAALTSTLPPVDAVRVARDARAELEGRGASPA